MLCFSIAGSFTRRSADLPVVVLLSDKAFAGPRGKKNLSLLSPCSHNRSSYTYRGAASRSHLSSHPPRGQVTKAVSQRAPPEYGDLPQIQNFDKNAYV